MSRPVHCIADCMTCGWRCESVNCMAVGKIHAKKHGHKVTYEIAYAGEYDYENQPGQSPKEEKND